MSGDARCRLTILSNFKFDFGIDVDCRSIPLHADEVIIHKMWTFCVRLAAGFIRQRAKAA
jgi:hypothetical protein